uniref:Uncharacterized protein n=1 Tax=Fervidicoccus fontis TaxID=683846 RepID=A0A7J3ZJR8_9CREN
MEKRVKAEVKANLQLLEEHLGDAIEELILKHSYAVDLEEDFDDLIRKIYKSLVKAWFGGGDPKPEKFESKIKEVKKRWGNWLKDVLLSYLIGRYVSEKARREEDIIRRRIRWDE